MSAWRCDREDRAASTLVTAGVTSPPARYCTAWKSAGSQFALGAAWERIPISPVFGTPFGLSAAPRFVQVIAGTIALNGTPATAAFQTSPPPRDKPNAPICVSETSLRPANHAKRSCASCVSLALSSPNFPPEEPVPRASQASVASPNSCMA